jgi:hypothetical protein
MQTTTRDPKAAKSPAASNAKPRGWWGRNWKRLFLSLFVLALLGAGGGYFYKFGRILISEPYHQAIADLKLSPEVKKLLGEPLQDNWFPIGGVNSDLGEARFTLKVHGPKAADGQAPKAEVAVQGRLVTGKWGFTQFEVRPESGQPFSLVDEITEREGSDVKRFDPNAIQPPLPKTQSIAPPDVKIEIPDMPSDSGNK